MDDKKLLGVDTARGEEEERLEMGGGIEVPKTAKPQQTWGQTEKPLKN